MARPQTRTLLAAGIPIALLVLVVAAWAIDAGASGGRVMRNVTLDTRDVGRLEEAQLTSVVARVAADYADTPVEIRTTGQTYRSTAGELGLSVDQKATVADALDVGRTGAWPLRPVNWVASFASAQEAPLRFRIRQEQLALVLIALEGVDGRQPTEPRIVGSPDAVGITGGESGFTLDPDQVADKLLTAAEAGRDPLTIRTEPVEKFPTISDADAEKLAQELTFKTSRPLVVKADEVSTEVPVATVRGWLSSEAGADGLKPTIDGPRVVKDLQALLTGLDAEKQDASIALVNGTPQITPSVDGRRCCAADTPDRVLQAIVDGQPEATIALEVDEADFTTADAEALGIKEPVGTTTDWKGVPQVKSFTTYHDAGGNRVSNIHRMADLVRGAIILPGKTFSINEHVGKRTLENGFLEAGAIANGESVQDVGGGVSQFATTLFNAAFFAGLDFGEYQSHSIEFDRYPVGREATLGFEHPDLQIENTSPYGVLIWTSYTDTSITVTLYSTQHVYGQQTGQSTSPQGNCKRVTTTRTRTWSDGRTAEDEVYGVYRPDYGINC